MAANTLSIVREIQRVHWPAIKRAWAAKNWGMMERHLSTVESACHYAVGMNEYVVTLRDTFDWCSAVSSLREAAAGRYPAWWGDRYKTEAETLAAARAFYMRELAKHGPVTWKRILTKYKWQEGMRGEEVQAEAKRIINRAYTLGGKRLGGAVADTFFAAGPAAAEKKLKAGLKRRGLAAPRASQPRGAAKFRRGACSCR